MSRLTIAGAACAVWLAASPAAAEPFQTFIDMCLDTNLDRQRTDALAKGGGWTPIPAGQIDLGEDVQDAAIYANVDPAAMGDKGAPDDFEMLMTGRSSGEAAFDMPGVQLTICMVFSTSADPNALQDRLQTLLGSPPTEMENVSAWIFSRAGSTFRSEASVIDLPDEEALRVVTERKVYIAAVLPEDDVVGLMLATIRPNE